MARVYLETSFISACVTDRTDAASVYRRETSREWWQQFRAGHELVMSQEVVRELSNPSFRAKDAAFALVADVPLLDLNDEVRGFASILVRHKVMPGPIAGDAVHVAAAAVHRAEFMLSWNVRHLANPNKADHLALLCLRMRLTPPRIVTPDLLWS